ncbi:hypothetical protein Dd703_0706 [Musicola paradisiaca Ech703]|uniref:Uncharacterized protein n=1 Tax=Musicola paradisiaca (strain Ech703) TaxID=579405 RepID=C6CA42_MUSP7|nr:hypothetical protein Dd703_0706 [Musicola paradisiaca Ech703]
MLSLYAFSAPGRMLFIGALLALLWFLIVWAAALA